MAVDEAERWTVTIDVPEEAELVEAGERFELSVREDETILSAARADGLWLPADCQQGWCITCAARLEEGEVDMSAARRYYDSDEAAGYVLTCVAKPRSDLRLVVGQSDALLQVRADNDQPPGRSKLN